MICGRCGREIKETHQREHYNYTNGITWRTNVSYAKINIWQPEEKKSEKPQTVALCSSCYEDLVDFFDI